MAISSKTAERMTPAHGSTLAKASQLCSLFVHMHATFSRQASDRRWARERLFSQRTEMAGRIPWGMGAFDLDGLLESSKREFARRQNQAQAKAREASRAVQEVIEDFDLPDAQAVVRTGVALVGKRPVTPSQAPRTPAESRKAGTPSNSAGSQQHSIPDMRAVEAWLDQSPTAKRVAGNVVRGAALAPGFVRGGWHMGEDIVGAVGGVASLIDPREVQRNAAWDRAAAGGAHLIEAAKDAVADPGSVVDAGRQAFEDLNKRVNPTATPVEQSFADEMRRNFDIGMNQGELVFDGASLVAGGPALKTVSGLGKLSKATTAAEYMARGLSPDVAKYFATPYKGIGSHYLPRRTKLPALLGGGPVPKQILDSPFFLLKPKHMTTGDFYELHFKVDPKYHGGPIPREFGGGGWSGKKLGWEKHDRAGRLWHGAPGLLKTTVGGGVAGANAGSGAAFDQFYEEGESR